MFGMAEEYCIMHQVWFASVKMERFGGTCNVYGGCGGACCVNGVDCC